ncbi:hypothetical protein MRB53_038945 [Persea americana]|nr:hypothetical protein MRB53_038945 [Persea americana]
MAQEEEPKHSAEEKGKSKETATDAAQSNGAADPTAKPDGKTTKDGKDDASPDDEEDLQLKNELEMLVERLRVSRLRPCKTTTHDLPGIGQKPVRTSTAGSQGQDQNLDFIDDRSAETPQIPETSLPCAGKGIRGVATRQRQGTTKTPCVTSVLT